MIKIKDFVITPEQAKDEDFIRKLIQKEASIGNETFDFRWVKRSIDARNRNIKINARFEICIGEEFPMATSCIHLKKVEDASPIHIIGAGPAGLFAALRAIELGFKPILFERGKDVQERRRDLAEITKNQKVNPESNYCFGEGGAGTYSDGKLYTRSKKRGDVQKVLEWFVHFGATPDILIDAHPHIGTNKLFKIIIAMREAILTHGGEIHFNSKLTDIVLQEKQIHQLIINETQIINCQKVILATGHSARDIYYLLHRKGIAIQSKGFALGVRIEHTQQLIDKIQYHGRVNDDFLPPASYSLVTQVDGKGVYSFCMCPGGIIAPCATEEDEVVTNGWSPSKRNNPYSNSGVVVQIDAEDFAEFQENPFVCLDFQKAVEKRCWEEAGKTQRVPAQRMLDFVQGKLSADFPRSSYLPGIISCDLNKIFPKNVASRLKKAFVEFDKKMPGYLTNDAVLHAPESRTSSPIQIPRNSFSFTHIDIKNLYPCAEGAGYAGGIASAAIDGMKCVEKACEQMNQ